MTGDVVGEINYFTTTTDGCAPWFVTQAVLTKLRSNLVLVPIPVTIKDLRGNETSVNLDTNGFEVIEYNGIIQEEFEKDSEAQKTYFEEISNMLKKRLGASRVIIYHYCFRVRDTPLNEDECCDARGNPAFYPHVDVDSVGVQGLIEKILSKEEAEKSKKNRVQAVNVWRPLGHNPIANRPLTLCDYYSVDIKKDAKPYTFRTADGDYTGYIMSCNQQDAHKWYYLSLMRSNEMFIFKLVDTKPDVAQYAFHTAFRNSNDSITNKEQKSVELRCLIFYDE